MSPLLLSKKIKLLGYIVLFIFLGIPLIVFSLKMTDISKSVFHYESKDVKLAKAKVSNEQLKTVIESNKQLKIIKQKIDKVKEDVTKVSLEEERNITKSVNKEINKYTNKLNHVVKVNTVKHITKIKENNIKETHAKQKKIIINEEEYRKVGKITYDAMFEAYEETLNY